MKPIKPFPPMPYEYDEKIERKYIYSYYHSAREDDWGDDDEEDRFNGEEWTPKKDIGEVDLAWLLTQAPEGVKLSDIKVELGEDSCCMSFDGYYVRFYYEVKIPGRKAEFKAAKKKYEEDLKQWEKDEVAYKEAYRLEEIKKMEDKLAKLKERKNA